MPSISRWASSVGTRTSTDIDSTRFLHAADEAPFERFPNGRVRDVEHAFGAAADQSHWLEPSMVASANRPIGSGGVTPAESSDHDELGLRLGAVCAHDRQRHDGELRAVLVLRDLPLRQPPGSIARGGAVCALQPGASR